MLLREESIQQQARFFIPLKPIGKKIVQNRVNTDKNIIEEVSIDPATDDEIRDMVAVMEANWQMWLTALAEAGVLANGVQTTAYTYR